MHEQPRPLLDVCSIAKYAYKGCWVLFTLVVFVKYGVVLRTVCPSRRCYAGLQTEVQRAGLACGLLSDWYPFGGDPRHRSLFLIFERARMMCCLVHTKLWTSGRFIRSFIHSIIMRATTRHHVSSYYCRRRCCSTLLSSSGGRRYSPHTGGRCVRASHPAPRRVRRR